MTQPEKPGNSTALVIGGGIIGLACANGLQRRGIATTLFDPSSPVRSASWGNAGHIAVEQVEPLAAPGALASLPRRLFCRGGAASFPLRDIGAWLPFGWRLLRASGPRGFAAGKLALSSLLSAALPAWRRLTSSTGSERFLVEDGHYIVWESERGARAGRAHWRNADIGVAKLHDLTRQEAGLIASLISRAPADGMRFVGTARVRDPGLLHEALSRAFVASGGLIRNEGIRELQVTGSRASALTSLREALTADHIVMSAGVGSAGLLRPLGYEVPIIAERGYHLQSAASEWPDIAPVVFEERSMIVSRFETGLRAASFVEFSRESSPPDPRKWQRLRSHVAALRLPMTSPPSEWMGVRPTLPDYLPALGRSTRADNLIFAFGHQHLGLTLAAVTGEIVSSLVLNEAATVDLAPFALERFG